MAHLIAPPSSVAPMSKEDIALVKAEKSVDARTREQLVKVYGDSRGAHSQRIALTRPVFKSWKCPVCGKQSQDIRHVCEYCLAPEPGSGAGAGAASVRRPGTSEDDAVSLLHTKTTGRSYRIITEPVVPSNALERAALGAAGLVRRGGDGDEDPDSGVGDVYEDEPGCGPGGRSMAAEGEGFDTAPAVESALVKPPTSAEKPKPAPPPAAAAAAAAASGAATTVAGEASVKKAAKKEKGPDFTHFIAIPIGKLPEANASAEALLTELREFLAAREDPTAARPPRRRKKGKKDSAPATADTDEKKNAEDTAAVAEEEEEHEEKGEEEEKDGEADGSRPSSPPPTAGEGAKGTAQVPATATSHLSTSLVAKTPRLHFTLLLLTLPTPADVRFAGELLEAFGKEWQKLKASILADEASPLAKCFTSGAAQKEGSGAASRQRPLVSVGGMHVMPTGKDNKKVEMKRATVVYMGFKDEASQQLVTRLQKLLHDTFNEIILDHEEAERSRAVLHMTILNKKWQRRGSSRAFDATEVMERFAEASIGAGEDGHDPIPLEVVELNRLGKIDEENTTYIVDASVAL